MLKEEYMSTIPEWNRLLDSLPSEDRYDYFRALEKLNSWPHFRKQFRFLGLAELQDLCRNAIDKHARECIQITYTKEA